MEFSSAQMSCVFKVNIHCDGCKREVMEVLQNLKGVYSVVMDPEQGTVKVRGIVNPCQILSIFDEYGKHGELLSLRFDGQVLEDQPFYFDGENDFFCPPHPMIVGPPHPFLLPPPPPLPPGLLPPPLLHPPPPSSSPNPTVQPSAPPRPPVASSLPENPKRCCSTM